MCCKGVSLSIRCGPCVRQQQTLRFARQGSRLLRAFNVANFFYLTAYSLILVNADAKSRGHAIFFGEEHNDMIAWVCSITGSLLFLTTSVLGWFEADLKDANGCGGVRGCILRRLTWSHLHAFLFFLGSVLNVTMELVPMEGARRGAPRVYNYDNQAMLASTNSSRHSLPLESFAGMRLYILSIHGGADHVCAWEASVRKLTSVQRRPCSTWPSWLQPPLPSTPARASRLLASTYSAHPLIICYEWRARSGSTLRATRPCLIGSEYSRVRLEL